MWYEKINLLSCFTVFPSLFWLRPAAFNQMWFTAIIEVFTAHADYKVTLLFFLFCFLKSLLLQLETQKRHLKQQMWNNYVAKYLLIWKCDRAIRQSNSFHKYVVRCTLCTNYQTALGSHWETSFLQTFVEIQSFIHQIGLCSLFDFLENYLHINTETHT